MSPKDDSQMGFTLTNSAASEETETEEMEASENKGPSVYSISELNRLIKSSLESEFPLVWIRGEISNFKPHYSGHWYFNLKDEKAQISAVMFKGFNQKLKISPEDGMEVLVRGRITVYEPRGTYQIMCELIEPVGLGALQAAFEKLKKKLAAEGLFDEARKKPIPRFPTRIAIVTSPTGAAIKDMLNVLTRRFKGIEITLIPTPVQGEGSAKQIAQAIETANRVNPKFDVMIVGRGGGSIEDLWAFNEEVVARAIANSQIPVISAVGHEIDFTISDFVADLRAPTPSAAAELVVENALHIITQVEKHQRSLTNLIRIQLNNLKQQVVRLSRHIVDPKRKLQDSRARCTELSQRVARLMMQTLESYKQDLDHLGMRLESETSGALKNHQQNLARLMGILGSLSPLGVVERGYSIVTKNGKVVKSAKDVKEGEEINIQLAQGHLTAEVKGRTER